MNVVQNNVASVSGRVSRDVLRERALDAARRVMAAEGHRALSARGIAAEIGVAVGTLYNLFDNFEEVILRLNLETLRQMADALETLPPGPDDPAEAILVIGRAYLDFTAARRNRWASVLEFKTSTPHRFQADFPATIARLVATVERALAPLFPSGAEPARRLSAAVLWTSLEGISALTAADTLRMVALTSAREMAEALIVNYVGGLKHFSVLPGDAAALPS